MVVQRLEEEPRSVAKSVCVINVTQEHGGCVYLERHLMTWYSVELTTVEELLRKECRRVNQSHQIRALIGTS